MVLGTHVSLAWWSPATGEVGNVVIDPEISWVGIASVGVIADDILIAYDATARGSSPRRQVAWSDAHPRAIATADMRLPPGNPMRSRGTTRLRA